MTRPIIKRFLRVLSALCVFVGAGGCATTHLWDLTGVHGPSLRIGGDNGGEVATKALLFIVGTPVCLVWDTVTLPVQAGFGFHPYGDQMAIRKSEPTAMKR